MIDSDKETREQRFIRIGRACNFACKFCNISDNEDRYSYLHTEEELQKAVDKIFQESKEKNIEVTISGGEPSLFQDQVRFVLKELDKKFPIEIQTNASNIDKAFSKDLKAGGVDTALVSFHTVSKGIFEDLLEVSHDQLEAICSGMENLIQAGVEVIPNIVLTKINLPDLLPTIQFLLKNFPSIPVFNIGVFQPHGEGKVNQDVLYIPFKEVSVYLKEAIELLESQSKNICFHYCSLPPCFFLPEHKKHVLEYHNYHHFRRENLQDISEKKTETNINFEQKYKKTVCDFCYEKNYCGGIWKENEAESLDPILSYKDF